MNKYMPSLPPDTTAAQQVLTIAKAKGAILYGDFTLASGKKSNRYYNGKKVTLAPDGAYWVGKAIFDRLAGLNIDAVGGLEMGAVPIAAAVALVSYIEGQPVAAFIVRQSAKDHGTKSPVEGYLNSGDKVCVVDDVVTTGESVLKAVAAVKEAGGQVVKVIAIVDRHEGGSDRIRAEGYDFACLLDFWPSGEITTGAGK
jgi:orotate phosphoribosyltransferase